MRHWAICVVMGAGLSWAQPAYANEVCELEAGVQMTNASDAPWTIRVQMGEDSIPLNSPFDAIVSICSPAGMTPNRVSVDATMPAHKHGMNYEARMEKIDDDRYAVSNLLFHMPGVWRLEIIAYEEEKPHRFFHEVTLQ